MKEPLASTPLRPPTSRVARAAVLLFGIAIGASGSSGPAAAADLPQRLQVFGHLTQAYGESSVGTIQGAAEEGTTDLRKLAIQFRWQTSEESAVVIQLSHERLGEDLFQPKDEEVEIDWAFYERHLGPDTEIKFGRLNIPLGIYNEVRDVGTLLPFFNLPISTYAGVLSSAETVDGFSLAHTFLPRSDWALDAELYVGGWDTFQQQVDLDSRFGIGNRKARAEDGAGMQLWFETPVTGLRIGAGALTWLLDGPLSVPGTKDRWRSWHLSIDMTGERWIVRAEKRRWEFDLDIGQFLGLEVSLPARARRDGYYVQIGCWLTPEIGLFAQIDDVAIENDLIPQPSLKDFHEAAGVSLNYRFRPDLLAKVEFHRADTMVPLGSPDLPVGVGQEPVRVEWLIVGLSVSF